MRAVVLGTGTDVGKTYFTCQLAAALAARTQVVALKPVESGVASGQTGDAGAIAAAAGHPPLLSPWRFTRGVSPHLASREQGITVNVRDVVAWVEGVEQGSAAAVTLIETAGGAFSPLAPGVTNVDLALGLEPALWLLVAPDSLGVLHDVTATLRALPRAPDALVLCGARPPDASSGSNAAELARLGVAQVRLTLEPQATDVSAIATWLLAHPSFKSG